MERLLLNIRTETFSTSPQRSPQVARSQQNGAAVVAKTDLLSTAKKAFQQTQFFKDVYKVEPNDICDIPYLSVAGYYRADGILDCIVDAKEIIGILPPLQRNASRFPFTIPEDEAELILRQSRIVRAMQNIGVRMDSSQRFLIVADENCGPFACEVSKGFYWEGHQASLSCLTSDDDDLHRVVDDYSPDYVVLASGHHLRHRIARPPERVILLEHCSTGLIQDVGNPTMLYADEVDLIGSRPVGEAKFDYDASQLLIEIDPVSQLSHITKLQFTCFPLIRYGLGLTIPLQEM